MDAGLCLPRSNELVGFRVIGSGRPRHCLGNGQSVGDESGDGEPGSELTL